MDFNTDFPFVELLSFSWFSCGYFLPFFTWMFRTKAKQNHYFFVGKLFSLNKMGTKSYSLWLCALVSRMVS